MNESQQKQPSLFAAPRFGREDAILLAVTTTLSVFYGIVHDHMTATLSPEYFLVGKDLANDPRAFRWAVTILAAKATWPLGVLAGMAFRYANEPSNHLPRRLSFRQLMHYVGIPIVAAAAFALLLGALPIALDPWDQRIFVETFVSPEHSAAFVRVWRVHIGSYVGGALGLLLSIALMRWRRAHDK
jgi:hypothetical protein